MIWITQSVRSYVRFVFWLAILGLAIGLVLSKSTWGPRQHAPTHVRSVLPKSVE